MVMTSYVLVTAFPRRLLAAVLLLGTLGTGARAACPRRAPEVVGGTQGYVDVMANGECYAVVSPVTFPGMVYRTFTFFDTGLLMVFNSYGKGGNTDSTAAREFYFFPRSGRLELKMDAQAGTVSVTMANGDEIDVDTATAQIQSSSRGVVTVARRVSPANRGGTEFRYYDGLMLDVGFARGDSPASSPDGVSVFRNRTGRRCSVANRELFNYSAHREHVFKFTDAELSNWLRKRCPDLKVPF
jgi:hypothetical protein